MYRLSEMEIWHQRREEMMCEAQNARFAHRSSRKTAAAALVFVVTLMALSLMLMAQPAHAQATFTVNSSSDPGGNGCNSTECTLREAITAANRTSSADVINFNIVGGTAPVKTISVTSTLPTITEPVTIDGYTQPGASPNALAKGTNAQIKIELDGSNLSGDVDGLLIRASDTVVRGLAINGFDQGRSGIRIDAVATSVTGVKIEGNFIGTDASGIQALGNTSGVTIASISSGSASANTIGGTTPAARNLISGNTSSGVELSANLNTEMLNNSVEGNLIGTDPSGTQDLGNGGPGVSIRNAVGTAVGGSTQSSANTLAFNAEDGVMIEADSGSPSNRVLSNSIFSNGGLGIDLLGPDEGFFSNVRTANDPRDADVGPNGLQNKPSLASATNSGGETTIEGRLSSKRNQTYVVRFFSNPSGENEGKQFIGQRRVKTGSDGKVSFTFVPSRRVGAGKTVTATATGPEGTSEFSAAHTVTAS